MDKTAYAFAPQGQSKPALRLSWLDQARGLALIAMIVYHALWDGFQFGLIVWTPERDAIMQTAARFIAGSFLTISGVALALAAAQTHRWILTERAFLRRLVMVATAAIAVSVATSFAIPQAPIYFGILHHIALASLIIALGANAHAFVSAAAAAFVALVSASFASPLLNHPSIIWLGLGTQAPVTADWVPLFPWLSAGLLGFAFGKQFIVPRLKPSSKPQRSVLKPLSWMGRHSLAIYLIHQPILIGIIYIYQYLK